ncbi:MAG TPA: ring-cleaving dioxygenase [Longimicrobiales bacterium]|nr:ring-cleaving dioxygenase [Longimicrobiales bacterium]
MDILGIHHVSAIAKDPQRNLDFYAGFMGLRLVKRTVNFDDPYGYHFYFGDEVGTPGNIMTFFPLPRVKRGRPGSGQVAVTSFAVLPGAIGFWVERLVRHNIPFERPTTRNFGDDTEYVIAFKDHDGLMLEIVGHRAAESQPLWDGAHGISRDNAIRGFHHVTLWVEHHEPTERVLADILGFRASSEIGATRRFVISDGGPSKIVDVREIGGFGAGVSGAGTVHHVAFAVPDDETELSLRSKVEAAGMVPTAVIDRNYFHSVYFNEPGGVLYELATNQPGFTIDESVSELGKSLRLPPQFEPNRADIEEALPQIHLPEPWSESNLFSD